MAEIKKIKLKNGQIRYTTKIYLGVNPATGKRTQTSITRKTKKEVERKIRELKDQIDKGYVRSSSNPTFEEVYKEWRVVHDAEAKPITIESVESKFKVNILPYLANLRVKKITSEILQNMLNEMAKKAKKKSIENYKMYTNQVLRFAKQKKYILENPMEFVKIPKLNKDFLYDPDSTVEKRKYWTKDEVLDFLRLAKEEFSLVDYSICHIILFSGMRKGEAQALLWSDIDFGSNVIHIRKTLAFEKGEFFLQTPKSKASVRSISMDQQSMNILKYLRIEQKKGYLKKGWQFDKNGPVFNSHSDGSYMRMQHLNTIMDAYYLRHESFYRVTIHQWRHTHASLLFESGASLKDVQHRLGHEDIQTTMNIYTHVTHTKAKATQSNFAAFMGIN